MILPYKYPDGRESRHARHRVECLLSGIQLYELKKEIRIKTFWGYRYREIVSVPFFPEFQDMERILTILKKKEDEARQKKEQLRKFRKYLERQNSE